MGIYLKKQYAKYTTLLSVYLALMRLDKPVGLVLLAWPVLWALWIAAPLRPSPKLVFIFLTGVVLMRSAGCVINDYFDRHFDGQVTRTCQRPLATGQISAQAALILFILLCLIAATLLFFLPPVVLWLSIPAVLITIAYPYLKRITHLPQFILGIAFSWSIPMIFVATLGHVPLIGWWLFITACCWPIAYDTMYAMVDKTDDLRIGIKSTAILWGNKAITVIAGFNLAILGSFIGIGVYKQLSAYFYSGLFIAALLMVYQHYLLKKNTISACFKAFLYSQWVGGAIFLGLLFNH